MPGSESVWVLGPGASWHFQAMDVLVAAVVVVVARSSLVSYPLPAPNSVPVLVLVLVAPGE